MRHDGFLSVTVDWKRALQWPWKEGYGKIKEVGKAL